jgi:hypothetical protein
MINVVYNDGMFIVELDEKVAKVLKRSADEWNLTMAEHLQGLLINLFENKIHEYKNRDGPLMAEKYGLLSEADQRMIDKLLLKTLGSENA